MKKNNNNLFLKFVLYNKFLLIQYIKFKIRSIFLFKNCSIIDNFKNKKNQIRFLASMCLKNILIGIIGLKSQIRINSDLSVNSENHCNFSRIYNKIVQKEFDLTRKIFLSAKGKQFFMVNNMLKLKEYCKKKSNCLFFKNFLSKNSEFYKKENGFLQMKVGNSRNKSLIILKNQIKKKKKQNNQIKNKFLKFDKLIDYLNEPQLQEPSLTKKGPLPQILRSQMNLI